MTSVDFSAGLFISFEGIDGAGKSTHIASLASAFRAQNHAVTITREPGGTPLAEKIRHLVLYEAMDPLTEALLVFAARRDHLNAVVLPALARGEVVLCDRFTDATFAYQGGGRGFDWQVLTQLEQWVQGAPNQTAHPTMQVLQPALTLWFDLPPQEAAARLAQARTPDRFEAEPIGFFQRVVQGYVQRQQADPQRFVRIDAAQSQQAVWQELHGVFLEKGWLV